MGETRTLLEACGVRLTEEAVSNGPPDLLLDRLVDGEYQWAATAIDETLDNVFDVQLLMRAAAEQARATRELVDAVDLAAVHYYTDPGGVDLGPCFCRGDLDWMPARGEAHEPLCEAVRAALARARELTPSPAPSSSVRG